MTIKEVYDIVKGIDEKLDQLVNKDDCEKKHGIVWKVMFALFGVNMMTAIALIITIWFKK